MFVRGQVGLGQDITSELSSLSSIALQSDSTTGLPFAVEIGLGLLGAILLARWAGRGRKRFKSYRRKSTQAAARRAQLRAELAAL